MVFNWLKKIFFNNKNSKHAESLIKELKVKAAELAVFKEREIKRLKAESAGT